MPVISKIVNRLYAPYLSHWRSKRHTDDVLATIDHNAFRKALLPFKLEVSNKHYQKYLNTPYWMRMNVIRAFQLGLPNKTGEPLHILDIGSGFGYFPYVARFFNHRVIGFDLPGETLFDKAVEFLELDIRHFRIDPKKKLEKFSDEKFDLVTAFQVCFNGHRSEDRWGVEEWKFFLDDLFTNHLKDNGKLYMDLNYDPQIGAWLPEDVMSFIKSNYNCKMNGFSRITISNK